MNATIDVVVVLPCAPATAMLKRKRISSASISARGITGIWRRIASSTSGFVAFTADEITTTSASPTALASWPRVTPIPRSASRSVIGEPFSSEPVVA